MSGYPLVLAKCPWCAATFRGLSDAKRHALMTHGKVDTKFQIGEQRSHRCQLCNFMLYRLYHSIRGHLFHCHKTWKMSQYLTTFYPAIEEEARARGEFDNVPLQVRDKQSTSSRQTLGTRQANQIRLCNEASSETVADVQQHEVRAETESDKEILNAEEGESSSLMSFQCPKCAVVGVTFPSLSSVRSHIIKQHSMSIKLN